MSQELLIETKGEIGYIKLNRPHVHNAISISMWRSIPLRLDELEKAGARTVVFCGKGDSFASGADLDELRQIGCEQDARLLWHSILGCLEHVFAFSLPTIAMIRGSCIGGGCLLATACDFRIATAASIFEIPVARLGLLLDDRTIARVVAAGGVAFARELLLAAGRIGAQKALALGYLLDAVDDQSLAQVTQALAERIGRNVSASVCASKRAINLAALQPASSVGAVSDQSVVESYLGAEFRRRVEQA